ncbi:hypothetical protein PVAP13_8KG385130 [Panicum virgatum]|uniref:Uncharacterized protein n=1 Tax=Panicum virgatum TaxID=38727 RepID=A0A8T0PQ93_PANVG|nr:hypothetical protein PVAP13_8KG385130 [Panicum virgatum]
MPHGGEVHLSATSLLSSLFSPPSPLSFFCLHHRQPPALSCPRWCSLPARPLLHAPSPCPGRSRAREVARCRRCRRGHHHPEEPEPPPQARSLCPEEPPPPARFGRRPHACAMPARLAAPPARPLASPAHEPSHRLDAVGRATARRRTS